MNRIDRMLSYIMPAWAQGRARDRMMSRYYENTERNLVQLSASYRSGVQTRTDQTWVDSYSSTGVRHLRRANHRRMRDRARQLDRDNTLAGAILDRAAENVVSTGFKLQARSPDATFNARVEALWADWSDTCDIRNMLSFSEIEQLVYRAAMRDGDVGVHLLPDGRIQPLEGDLIETPLPAPKNAKGQVVEGITEGVQLNRTNRPVAYWIKDTPSKRIPARNFIFIPRMSRLNQVRGEPVFAPVMPLFDQIDGYTEASIMAARMAANFGLFWKTKNSPFASLAKEPDSGGTNRPQLMSEPGQTVWAGPDDDITQIKPEHPHQNFGEFLSTLARFTGLKLGVPLELGMLDFTRANYSQTRGVLLQSQRAFRIQQAWLVKRFHSRLYRWRVSKWVKAGQLPELPEDDTGPTMWRHDWIAPGWPWIDPLKEIQAVGLALDLNLTNRTDEVSKLGKDWQENVAKQQAEQVELAQANLGPVRMNSTRDPASE